MKKDQATKRQALLLILFVLVLLFMYYLNSQSSVSKNLPEVFVTRESVEESTNKSSTLASEVELSSGSEDQESHSTSSVEVEETVSYNGEQDLAARFAVTYLSFTEDSMEKIQSMIAPTLSSKLEQLEQEEQEIDSLSLLDKSTLDDQNIYVYEFKATLKDGKNTKKSGKIFVIVKPPVDKESVAVVSDVEWTYEA